MKFPQNRYFTNYHRGGHERNDKITEFALAMGISFHSILYFFNYYTFFIHE